MPVFVGNFVNRHTCDCFRIKMRQKLFEFALYIYSELMFCIVNNITCNSDKIRMLLHSRRMQVEVMCVEPLGK